VNAGLVIYEIVERNLAEPPDLSWALTGCWSQFTEATDAFLGDHFGLRKPLLASNAHVRGLLDTPASPDVLVGRDGWLFYARDTLDHDAERDRKASARVVHQARMLEAMARYHERRGAAFSVVIAPDKHTIYPEMLPDWASARLSSVAYDRLVAELRRRKVKVVDVRDDLRAAKAQGPLYYRTDTHWTRIGSRIAFNKVLAAVGKPAVAKGAIDWAEGRQSGHDLDRMALLGGTAREFDVDQYPVKREVTVEPLTLPDGSKGYRAVRPGSGPTTLILGDSFSNESFKTLALEVGPKLVWMQHRKCQFDPAEAEGVNAGLVIYEIVERNLGCDRASADAAVAEYASGRFVPREPPPEEVEEPLQCQRAPQATDAPAD
jgi:hypothetical protein